MLTQVVRNAPWDSCSAAFCEAGKAIDSVKYYDALCLEQMAAGDILVNTQTLWRRIIQPPARQLLEGKHLEEKKEESL